MLGYPNHHLLHILQNPSIYFAEYLTFRKSKGIYYPLISHEPKEVECAYLILDHMLNLSLHSDNKQDTKVEDEDGIVYWHIEEWEKCTEESYGCCSSS